MNYDSFGNVTETCVLHFEKWRKGKEGRTISEIIVINRLTHLSKGEEKLVNTRPLSSFFCKCSLITSFCFYLRRTKFKINYGHIS